MNTRSSTPSLMERGVSVKGPKQPCAPCVKPFGKPKGKPKPPKGPKKPFGKPSGD